MAGGRRRAQGSVPRVLVLGAVTAVFGWAVLVGVAIELGQNAAAGHGAAGWAGTVLTGIAATLCLLAAFVLLGRLWARGVPWRSTPGTHRRW